MRDAETIGRLLIDGYPLVLVDRVVALEPGRRIVALKSVSGDEPFFAGHFPGWPVMPGVLLCEAFAQAGVLLAAAGPEGMASGRGLRRARLDRARFRQPVRPGDQLELEVTTVERAAPSWRMRGVARVAGVVVAEADLATVETAGPAGALVHPTAIIAAGAELAADVEVGPYAVIGPYVRIGAGTRIGAHAVLDGRTTLGDGNRVFPFASVGAEPQDLKYRGEESRLEIGHRNIIREFATLNCGTHGGGMVTRVGDGNLFMNYAHVGHDCRIGDNCVLANSAALAGHVTLEDYVIVGGLAAIHQFVRVGESALLAGGAMVERDVPPFCNAMGDRARLRGLNVIGLRRRGFGAERVRAIKHAYRLLFTSRLPAAEARARCAAELGGSPDVARMVAFLDGSKRGISAATRGRASDDDDPGD